MLNLMGVGYAAWSGNINILAEITTGYLKPYFEMEDAIITSDQGELVLKFLPDKQTLVVTGWSYTDFTQDLVLFIRNGSTLPVIFKNHPDGEQRVDVDSLAEVNINLQPGNDINLEFEQGIR